MKLSSNSLTIILSILTVWAICAVFIVMFPGLTGGNVIALGCISAAAITAPSYTPLASRGAVIVMGAAALLLGVGIILNTWYFTTYLGGTPDNPILINPDANRWWNDALFHIDNTSGEKAAESHGWYGYVLSAVLLIFGQTVGTALQWSMLLTLASLIFCGLLTWRISRNRTISVLAMACLASVCYWMSMGTLILKDAFTIFAMVIAGYGLVSKGRASILLLLLSAAMLLAARLQFIVLVIGGIFIVKARKDNWLRVGLFCIVCVALWAWLYRNFYSMNVSEAVTSDISDNYTVTAPQQMAFYNIFGNFMALPLYKKIVLTPFTAVVQFFIPFSWTYLRDIPYGITLAWAHFGYPWYVFGFIFIYYLVSSIKNFKTTLYRVSVYALLCWLVPCILMGGTVSRYGLPFVALMAPAVASTLYYNWKKRRFYISFAVFCVIISVVLVCAHHLQTSAM